MSDWIKIALKASLVVIICAALWGILLNIQIIPVITFNEQMRGGFGLAKTVINYYYPGFSAFLLFCLSVCAFRLGLMGLKVTLILAKWLYQLFE